MLCTEKVSFIQQLYFVLMEKNFYFGGQSDLYLDPVRAMAPEYLKIHLDTVTYRKAMLSHYEN